MAEQGFAVRLTARIDGYLSAMEQAKKATRGIADEGGTNFERLGGKMQDVGGKLTTGVTVPLLAVGGIAVKMSSDFEGAFGKMVGLAGVTADEVDGLKASVLDLAGETGQAPQDLADGLYFLRSSGLDAGKAMDALKQSAMASTAGLGSTAVIADAVSSAMNAYAKSGLSAAEATDILVGTARAGKAEPAELAGALGRVLPIASELGITFEDVGGAIAALSLSGNDASTSATLLSNIMSKMLKPSQQGAEALASVGTSAAGIRESIADKGLLATLEDLKTRLGDAGFVKFLEDAQAVQGALALTGQNAEQVHKVFDGVANSTGATSEAFGAMAETSGFKMKQAWAEIQVALIKAGDVIMPIVSGVAGAIGSLAGVFSDLPGPVQTIVVAFLGLVAAAGPLLMIGGSLVKNWKEIQSVMGKMPGSANASVAALAIVGVAMVGMGLQAKRAADQAERIADNIAKVSSAATDKEAVEGFINALSTMVASGQHAGDAISYFAETNLEGAKRILAMGAASGLAQEGLDQLRAVVEEQERATAKTTETTETFSGALAGTMDQTTAAAVASSLMKAATEELARSEEEATRKSEVFADSLQNQIDKLSELYPKEYDAVQAKYDYRDAAVDTMLKVADLNTTLGDSKATQEDVTGAFRTARDAILDTAEKYGTLDGAAAGSQGAILRQIESLEAQRDTLAPGSPLRAFLDEYIADLKAIPSNIDTFMNLHISSSAVNPGAPGYLPRYGGAGASGVRTVAGSYYEVTEGGRPEMYTEGGKRYLLPGGNGEVTPFTPAMQAGWGGSQGGSSTVNHNSITFGDIRTDMDMKAAWQQANFALISAAA